MWEKLGFLKQQFHEYKECRFLDLHGKIFKIIPNFVIPNSK